MILHYVAAGQIVLAIVFHVVRGGRSATVEHHLDRRVTLPTVIYSWYFVLGFFAGSAVTVVLPGVPDWMKIALSMAWLALGIANLVMSRAKETGGYFCLSTGVLILLGSLL